jgi:hypothetical protein
LPPGAPVAERRQITVLFVHVRDDDIGRLGGGDIGIEHRHRADGERAQSTVAQIESIHADPAFSTPERLPAAAGLEMRIRLEPLNDYDVVLAAIDRLRSPDERERVAAAHHQHTVERFAEGGRRAGLRR